MKNVQCVKVGVSRKLNGKKNVENKQATMPMIGMKTHHSTSLENLLAVPDLQQSELQLQQFVLQPTRKRFLGSCGIHYGRAEEMHCSFSSHFNGYPSM